MMSGHLINIVELAFGIGLKDIIAFLTIHLLTVLLGIKDNFHRDNVKSLAFATLYEMGALFARKRHRFPIVYKMRHYVLRLSNRKNTKLLDNETKK